MRTCGGSVLVFHHLGHLDELGHLLLQDSADAFLGQRGQQRPGVRVRGRCRRLGRCEDHRRPLTQLLGGRQLRGKQGSGLQGDVVLLDSTDWKRAF